MPVEFLSDEQLRAYGSFVGEPALAEVERFCYLDDGDRDLVAKRPLDSHRLGFAVQFGSGDGEGVTAPPLGHAHLTCLGRHAFPAQAVDGLRPLRDPATGDDTDEQD